MSDESCCGDCRAELYEEFSQHEVETVEDMLKCMDAPPTNSKFRRVIMLLLRAHYSHPENYPDDFDHLRCYVYHPPGTTSPVGNPLHVGYMHEFDDRKPDNFPGIYVGFGAMQMAKLAIANEAGHSEDNSAFLQAKGARITIEIHHVTKNLDAYEMAEMSLDMFAALSPMLRAATGAMAFEVAGYALAKKVEDAPDRYYDVVLSIEISYNHTVALKTESHRVRRISIKIHPVAASLNQP